ncbi:MAG: glycoside hydrolase family 19 protein [Blastocatellia bacterium]
MIIANEQLRLIMPKLSPGKRNIYLPFLNRVMEEYEINTLLRSAAFLAQLAHESGELRYMEEIWGPTEAQKRYDPPGSLAEKLGNTERGDGKRFKGRGPIQITGRFNYDRYGRLLGVDLVANPALAATPQIAFSIAGLYWRNNGLNQLADNDDIVTITRRINGGLNGLADRRAYYKRAKEVLQQGVPLGSVSMPDTLPRGQESIVEETTSRQRRLSPAESSKAAGTGKDGGAGGGGTGR